MTIYKQISENEVRWQDGDTVGLIIKGRVRTEYVDGEQVEHNEWERMLEQESAGEISIDWLTQEDKDKAQQEEQLQQFKRNRQQQLDNAVVTTSTGKQFDADEASIIRLGNALVAADGEPDSTIIQWSLANDGTGVMTDCTKVEIKEAHKLAMQNMSNIWSVE